MLVLMFTLTGFATKVYHSNQRRQAEEWYRRGDVDLKAGRASKAIADFRNALVHSRDNWLYRLRLAQALLAANQMEEARAYFRTLWDRRPADGTVNLELARLAVGDRNIAEATRYFHNAIFGVWEEDPAGQRRRVRLELCEFLLSCGAKSEAQAALIQLAADLPKDPRLYARVGDLFLKAEDYSRALDAFRQALRLDRQQVTALAGAGRGRARRPSRWRTTNRRAPISSRRCA
jgi:predicted Zn-dependent protease